MGVNNSTLYKFLFLFLKHTLYILQQDYNGPFKRLRIVRLLPRPHNKRYLGVMEPAAAKQLMNIPGGVGTVKKRKRLCLRKPTLHYISFKTCRYQGGHTEQIHWPEPFYGQWKPNYVRLTVDLAARRWFHRSRAISLKHTETTRPVIHKKETTRPVKFTGTSGPSDRLGSEREPQTMSSFTGSTIPFDDDGYIGYDPRLPSQRFDSFSNFDAESVKDSAAGDSSPIFASSQSYSASNDVFSSQPVPETTSPPSVYSAAGGFSEYSPGQNGEGFDGGFDSSDVPILPPPAEMQPEEGFALREWRRWFGHIISL